MRFLNQAAASEGPAIYLIYHIGFFVKIRHWKIKLKQKFSISPDRVFIISVLGSAAHHHHAPFVFPRRAIIREISTIDVVQIPHAEYVVHDAEGVLNSHLGSDGGNVVVGNDVAFLLTIIGVCGLRLDQNPGSLALFIHVV